MPIKSRSIDNLRCEMSVITNYERSSLEFWRFDCSTSFNNDYLNIVLNKIIFKLSVRKLEI